jgi:uncharacterized membrane protein
MESHWRSVAKAVSWRIVATFVTATVAWCVTGEVSFALVIGLVDTTVKIGFYYLHERVWNRLSVGRLGASRGAPPAS